MDTNFIETALKYDFKDQIFSDKSKKLLRDKFGSILPSKIKDRSDKTGFSDNTKDFFIEYKNEILKINNLKDFLNFKAWNGSNL